MKKKVTTTKKQPITKEYFEILNEDLRSNFKAVMESQVSIHKKLDNHEERFDEIDSKFETVFRQLSSMDERLDRIESEIKLIKKALAELKDDDDKLGVRIKELETELLELKRQYTSKKTA